MVSAGENRCFFLQDYVKADVDPATTRLATRVVGEALCVSGYLDGRVYQTQTGGTGYALSCNVTRVIYLTSKEQREALIAKRAVPQDPVEQAAPQPQPAYAASQATDGFMNVPEALEEGVPFQ